MVESSQKLADERERRTSDPQFEAVTLGTVLLSQRRRLGTSDFAEVAR